MSNTRAGVPGHPGMPLSRLGESTKRRRKIQERDAEVRDSCETNSLLRLGRTYFKGFDAGENSSRKVLSMWCLSVFGSMNIPM